MKLGAFSISLAVKDLGVSTAFYSKLGFASLGDSGNDKYAILTNGTAVIGLFEGMFEGNILTFNPGWNQDASPFDPFDDVRHIQNKLKSDGLSLDQEADATTSGPASICLTDPDGNAILIDQHR